MARKQAGMGPAGPVGTDKKAARWLERRKQRSTARNWGRTQGLRGDLNPLLWKNRQQHDNIAAWLAAAAAADQGGTVGVAGPQGDAPTWDTSNATQNLRGSALNASVPTAQHGRGLSVPKNTPFPSQWANPASFMDSAERINMPNYLQDVYARERDASGPMGPAPFTGARDNQYSGWGSWMAMRRQANPNYDFYSPYSGSY